MQGTMGATLRTRRQTNRPHGIRVTDSGQTLQLMAVGHAASMRANLALLVSELPERPQPKDLVRDVERGRPASLETFAKAETASARASTFGQILRYCERHMASLVALLPHQPTRTIDAIVEDEIDAGAEADKLQQRLRHYVETGDRVGVQRVVEATGQHLLAASEVYHRAVYERRLMDAAVTRRLRPVLTVVRGGAA